MGRFTQADTIIPDAGNSSAWDRYAYVLNNPLRYTDPSGHESGEPCEDRGYCKGITPTQTPTSMPTLLPTLNPLLLPPIIVGTTAVAVWQRNPTATATVTSTPPFTPTVSATFSTTTATIAIIPTITATSTMINPYIYTTLTSMPTISPVLAEKHPWPVDIHEIPVSPNNIYHEVHGPASFGGIGGMFDGISVNLK